MLCKNKNCETEVKTHEYCKKHRKSKKQLVDWKAKATLPVSVKNRNEQADYDYLEKLSAKDLLWLKGFNREFVNADFKHSYKKVHKSKKRIKDCFDRNNSRNRDLYSKAKVENKLFINPEVFEKSNPFPHTNLEENLISLIDREKDY